MDSSRKRKANTELVSNPFIKKRNLEWRISPPPFRDPECRRQLQEADGSKGGENGSASIIQQSQDAARPASTNDAPGRHDGDASSEPNPIENKTVVHIQTQDHLAHFSDLLTRHTLHPYPGNHPRLPVPGYQDLYRRSLGSRRGAHFVVTQHDHPAAGPHYDLRLQINETSSCSWAVMYGLPGDPNSRGRTGGGRGGTLRTAVETRVHCLWNHLVEAASPRTGSLMVWDEGEYEVLRPGRRGGVAPLDYSSQGVIGPGGEDEDEGWGRTTQQGRLAGAFAARKVRLRLRGARLPRGYTVNLRLTRGEEAAGRARAGRPGRPRRRGGAGAGRGKKRAAETSSDGDDADYGAEAGRDGGARGEGGEHNDGSSSTVKAAEGVSEVEKEERRGLEEEEVRRTNAYAGAVNTIGSVHQRKWFLSLDREACGFERSRKGAKVLWEKVEGAGGGGEEGGSDDDAIGHRYEWPFYVRGPDYERSVVTGRLGADILRDEGVVGFVRRKGWRPILS